MAAPVKPIPFISDRLPKTSPIVLIPHPSLSRRLQSVRQQFRPPPSQRFSTLSLQPFSPEPFSSSFAPPYQTFFSLALLLFPTIVDRALNAIQKHVCMGSYV